MKYLPWIIVGLLGLLNIYQYDTWLTHAKTDRFKQQKWKLFIKDVRKSALNELYAVNRDLEKVISHFPFEPDREFYFLRDEMLHGRFRIDTTDAFTKIFLKRIREYGKNGSQVSFIQHAINEKRFDTSLLDTISGYFQLARIIRDANSSWTSNDDWHCFLRVEPKSLVREADGHYRAHVYPTAYYMPSMIEVKILLDEKPIPIEDWVGIIDLPNPIRGKSQHRIRVIEESTGRVLTDEVVDFDIR